MNRLLQHKSLPLACLGLMIIAAALVRSTELGPSSLWTDDAWVALAIKEPWSYIWYNSLTSIGFRAIIRIMLETFGNTSLVAQFLPYVFSLLTIPMTYLVARQVKITPWFALFAAFMVASSSTLVNYSIRVKQYTGDALFTLVIVSILIWLIQHPEKRAVWIIFGLLCCLSIVYSGQLLVVIAPAVAFVLFYCWLYEKTQLRRALVLSVLTGLFSLYWYLAVLNPAVESWLVNYWSDKYIVIDQGIVAFLQSIGLRIGYIYNDGFDNTAVHIAGGLLLTLAALFLRYRLTLSLLLPVFLAIALAMAGKAPIGTRTDAYFLPLLALVMAIGAEALLVFASSTQRDTSRNLVRYSVYLLVPLLIFWGLYNRFSPREYPPHDIRTLTAIWERESRDHEKTFIHSKAMNGFRLYSNVPLVLKEEDGEIGRGRILDPAITLMGWKVTREPEKYPLFVGAKLTDEYNRVWLMIISTNEKETSMLKAAIMAEGFTKKQSWPTEGYAELLLYERSTVRR